VLIVQVPGGPDLVCRTRPYRTSLFDIRVIMVIMRVLVVELLCQEVTK
jgi:hypothetical protein